MGNAITTQFEVKEQVASGGPIFEKNFLENINPLAKPTQVRKEQERVIEILKREAQFLTKLRHPSLLEITEPLDDSRTALAYATEPILCNLSNVLGKFVNFQPANKDDYKEKYALDELEIQKGILQIVKALQFLHSNRIVHGHICPESIYINAKGDWKLAGFNFSTTLSTVSNGTSEVAHFLNQYPPYCTPSLEYLAPEYVYDEKCEMASDVWSLGCLIYSLFNNGASPIDCNQNSHAYRDRIERLHLLSLDRGAIPDQLRESIQRMLKREPSARISIAEFQTSPYFDNILISTIKYLDSFVEKTQVQKAQFLKGLVRVLPQFSERLLHRKILPALLSEMKDNVISPFILPNIFWISERMSDRDFVEKVLPYLKPVFKMSDPPQTVMLLISRTDLFLKKCKSPEVFRQDIMPLIYHALEMNVPQVQEQALKIIPTVVEKLDFTAMKSTLFPKIQAAYLSSPVLAVKVSALIALHALVPSLDKFTLIEKVIPMLKQNRTREPGLLMAVLVVHEELAKHLDKESIAGEILPELWKTCMDPLLNISQFRKYMSTIKELTKRVEELHMKHLEDLKTMEGNQKIGDTIDDFQKLVKGGVSPDRERSATTGSTTATTTGGAGLSNDFEKLVMGGDDPFSAKPSLVSPGVCF
ncbi:hypothetical protein HK102_002750 [Quaeritorhiza haematococci]|nr:hypothetical protein HK102_002750 [Quaeritorhiza haematococci]